MTPSRAQQWCLLSLLLHNPFVIASILEAPLPTTNPIPSLTTSSPSRQITATPAFLGHDLKKRDYWYICGYCCGISTLTCNNGAYCKVTHLAGEAYGYCSTVMQASNPVYTAVVDYTAWSTNCGLGTVCCTSASPYGFEYYFTNAGATTRMYGCDTTGYTVEGTAAANLGTETGISLYAPEDTTANGAFSSYLNQLTVTSNQYLKSLTSLYNDGTPTTTFDFNQEPETSRSSTSTSPTPDDGSNGGGEGDGDGLEGASNVATIVGSVVGSVVAIATLAAAIYYGRKQIAKKKEESKHGHVEMDERRVVR